MTAAQLAVATLGDPEFAASKPWGRSHIDFAGPVVGLMYMVVVDSYSKWLEVMPMRCTTGERVVEVLRTLFARFSGSWSPTVDPISPHHPLVHLCKRAAFATRGVPLITLR